MAQTLSGTVYFDNAATTPLLPCALERLQELSVEVIGNSSSAHRRGRQAQEVLDQSREILGRSFNVPPTHVIFTSGGTESNNLAIWGGLGGLVQAFQWLKSGAQGKVITSSIEHDATRRVFEALQDMGARVDWIKVDDQGLLDLNHLETALTRERIRLISLHHAQNEIGTLQDLRSIAQLVRSKAPDAILHLDAVQSFMKLPVAFEELGVDMISVSAHKIGGPKGIGALILGRRFENRTPKIGTLLNGAPQQFGLRPGTVPVPAIGAFISAVQWSESRLRQNERHLLSLRAALVQKLPSLAIINGPSEIAEASDYRAPQTLNFSLPGLPSAVTVEALSARGFCISAGAACHSTNPKPNATLMAMGVGRERALSAVRVSFSSQNTLEEVERFCSELSDVVKQFA